MKRKLVVTLALSMSLIICNTAFAAIVTKAVTPVKKVATKIVAKKVVAKPVVKKAVAKVLPLVYTWTTVRSKMLAANIGPNFRELKDVYETGPYVRLDYNYMPEYANGRNSYSNVFDISSLKGKVPNMDFTIGVFGNHSSDPKVATNATLAGNIFYETVFPKKGKEFSKLLEKVDKRYVVKGNMHINLPTVIFFENRRVIVDIQEYYYRMDFSAVNDKTDIWKEVYESIDGNYMKFTKAEFKKYMPELKNY
ncbi:MAG: hypothetical protein ACREV6_21535 [Clostridium sp.]|uniref:hypothetical protein n=1 Tax=Clostridium sp. TaxID=1506 RepID=UPI003D6CBF9A